MVGLFSRSCIIPDLKSRIFGDFIEIGISGNDKRNMMSKSNTSNEDIKGIHPVPCCSHPSAYSCRQFRGGEIEGKNFNIRKEMLEKSLFLHGFCSTEPGDNLIIGDDRNRRFFTHGYTLAKLFIPEIIDQEGSVENYQTLALPELRNFRVNFRRSSRIFESRSAPAYSSISRFFRLTSLSMTSEKLSSASLRATRA